MQIEKARLLKVGDYVNCPEDRGDKAYRGKVVFIGQGEYENHRGDPYMWITVEDSWRQRHVWPSNRLG